jgi:hypothetical protein
MFPKVIPKKSHILDNLFRIFRKKWVFFKLPGHRFGAAGLSRRSTLMDKPLEFNSLFDLIKDFDEAYRDCGHRLIKVKQ